MMIASHEAPTKLVTAQYLLPLKPAVVIVDQLNAQMNQARSLQEMIAKGRQHYYDGLSFRNWRTTMLNVYGHDTTPYLQDVWNAIAAEAESATHAKRARETANSRRVLAGTRPPTRKSGLIDIFGQLTMAILNVIACVMLLLACTSRLPNAYYTTLPWFCFAAFTFTAVWRIKDRAAVICFPLAFLFNPFYPVHLSRSLWTTIDVVSLLLLLAMTLRFAAKPRR